MPVIAMPKLQGKRRGWAAKERSALAQAVGEALVRFESDPAVLGRARPLLRQWFTTQTDADYWLEIRHGRTISTPKELADWFMLAHTAADTQGENR